MRIPCHLIKNCFLCLKSFCFWVQYVSKPYRECVETLEMETSYIRTPGSEKYCPITHDFGENDVHTTLLSNDAFWHIAFPLYSMAFMAFGAICFFLVLFYRKRRCNNRINGLAFNQQANDLPGVPQVSAHDVMNGIEGFGGRLTVPDEIPGRNSLTSTSLELELRQPFVLDFTEYANDNICNTSI